MSPRAVILTALALVALHAAQLGHLVLGRHGICPEHGEIIELSPAAQTAVPHPPAGASAVVDGQSEAVEHTHCPVFYGRRDTLAASPYVVRVLALHPPPADLKTPEVWSSDDSGRIELAPKQSPPVV
jgi:hypothetical protein